jgi:hypothetical protein
MARQSWPRCRPSRARPRAWPRPRCRGRDIVRVREASEIEISRASLASCRAVCRFAASALIDHSSPSKSRGTI